jgi:putative transcriptional regulator
VNAIALVLVALALTVAAPMVAADDRPNSVLLVATPHLVDPNFRETVVLATRHAGGGTIGVVLNRPTPVRLEQALPGHAALRGRPDRLFAGGPVAPRALTAVFQSKSRPAGDALRVLDDVYLSLDARVLEDVLGGPDGLPPLKIYAGYAGWAPGQLELELAREDWYVLEPDGETIFRADPGTLWRELLRRATARRAGVRPWLTSDRAR